LFIINFNLFSKIISQHSLNTDKNDIDIILHNSKQIKRKYIASTWNVNEENILQIWAEKASGWAWLHDKSQRYYRRQSDRLVYPSIILNTIAGGIGFINNKNTSNYIPYIIASMNIVSAMLTSFQKFYRSIENAELHSRYFSIFSSFTRKISLELTLNPEDRKDCVMFCKLCREEYDKAVSESPQIPDIIVEHFRKEFSHEKNKPEIANGLFHFTNYSKQQQSPKSKTELSEIIHK
jgi:hypothetical protein